MIVRLTLGMYVATKFLPPMSPSKSTEKVKWGYMDGLGERGVIMCFALSCALFSFLAAILLVQVVAT